jgi:hypothetical protein
MTHSYRGRKPETRTEGAKAVLRQVVRMMILNIFKIVDATV